jgi:DNA-binding response OmpR family regulator
MMEADRCVVAGDSSLFDALRGCLGPSGPDLEAARDGESAIRLLSKQDVAGLVLEDQLTDMRATEVLKRVREQPETRIKPVILVSGRDDEIDRVLAFELGADDFVSKPYSPRELALRLRAVLRRTQSQPEPPLEHLHLNRLTIDMPGHEVTVDGEVVGLTATAGLFAAEKLCWKPSGISPPALRPGPSIHTSSDSARNSVTLDATSKPCAASVTG